MKLITKLGLISSTVVLASMVAIGVQAYNQQLDDLATASFERQRDCLALNIYHEARAESELGQRAVAYVTLNRVASEDYPDDICDVIHQADIGSDGNPKKNQCQFSWYCDGKEDYPADADAYREALRVAGVVMLTYGNSFDPTMGATMYHARRVNPDWGKSYEKTTLIENHIFFKKG